MAPSLIERLAALPPEDRKVWLDSIDQSLVADIARQEWWAAARPEQMAPPGDWNIWLILAGRGFGKTRTGAEWIVEQASQNPVDKDGHPTEWAAFAQTNPDARLVLVEGPSGMLNVCRRRGIDVDYRVAPLQITLPDGQRIHARGADDPDVARGFNLAGAWLDEIAKWRYAEKAWVEGIVPALRTMTLDAMRPRAVITTTPKPLALLKELLARDDGSAFVTRGSTFDNAANLSEAALSELKRRYKGTRIGRQELYGELLLDVEGALWTAETLDQYRVNVLPDADTVIRRVVAVDPAVSSGEFSAENGIMTGSLTRNGHVYVEKDSTLKASPDGWARAAVAEYERAEADCVVVEVNQGGDMHKTILHTISPNLPVKQVRASQGKKTRAEPVAALYEQGKVHHVGEFPALETQLTEWLPIDPVSPDRLDALVWLVTELAFKGAPGPVQTFST